ncbi:MAG TPA: LbtU family siderophore porin [Dongiaceae bacterium]|nr:LbtU family siderophore porin [Dongiaceae bacterium]
MKTVRHIAFPMTALAWSVVTAVQAAEPQPSVEERLTRLEQQATTQPVVLPANLELAGTVEVEGTVGEGYDGRSYSDLVVATVEFGVVAHLNEKVSAEVVFLYEQDETDLGVDVAVLTIDQLIAPVDFAVGKMYVPFGQLQTALINDTLVLELAETNKTAALFGLDESGIKAAVYVFDGDQDREKHVENYGLTVGFVQDSFSVGVDYLSSITESDGLEDATAAYSDFLAIDPPFEAWEESAPAYAVHGTLNLGMVALIAEYLEVVDPLQPEAIDVEFEPSAAQGEVDLTAELFGHEYVFAVAYQKTDDAAALELPEERISLGCSTKVYDNVTLGGEFWHDADYDAADGGSDEESDNFVLQLAASF